VTKLYQEVYKLKAGAIQGMTVAANYGQHEAVEKWKAKILAYETVLGLLGDPEITPLWHKRVICKIFHQKYSQNCSSCGGQF